MLSKVINDNSSAHTACIVLARALTADEKPDKSKETKKADSSICSQMILYCYSVMMGGEGGGGDGEG